MKHFLKDIVLFGFFAIIIYVVVLVLFGLFVPVSLRSNLRYPITVNENLEYKLLELDTVGNRNVVFLGSSHCYRSFDPRIWESYGISSFNLGTSSQSHFQTRLFIEGFMEKLNPQYVIYEVYPVIFASDGMGSAANLIGSNLFINDLLPDIISSNDLKIYNEFIYSVFRNAFSLKVDLNQNDHSTNLYIEGGYDEIIDGSYNESPQVIHLQTDIKDRQIQCFKENLVLLDSLNINVILVYAPITHSAFTNIPYHSRIYNIIDSTNLTFLNFSQMPDLIDTIHFYDYHHLNQLGVEIFNSKLIEELHEKDLIPELK